MHGDIFGKTQEIFIFRHKIRFTIYFNQHPQLAAHMNVRLDGSLRHGSAGSFLGGCQPLFSKKIDSFINVRVALHKCLLAVHHSGTGFFPQLFNHRRANCCHLILLSFQLRWYLAPSLPARLPPRSGFRQVLRSQQVPRPSV